MATRKIFCCFIVIELNDVNTLQ